MPQLEIERLVLGDLDTNCYLASCPATHQTLIVDPADSGDFITDTILRLELKPIAILVTHGHLDHVLGILELKLNFLVPLIMHQADLALLKKAQASARHWLKRDVDPIPPPDSFVQEGDLLEIGECQLQIIETPGHTPGSICAYDENSMLTGDTLFKDGVGSSNHTYSNKQKLWNSIGRIREVGKGKTLFPGHGEHFSVV